MINEKISALIDHHGDPAQSQDLFDRILRDDGARKTWQRYHLIGCVLRGEIEQTGADLSERIRSRLEDEPTVLAPPARRRAVAWKSAGILALAASVAMLAVIMLKPAQNESAVNPAASQHAGAGLAQAGHAQTRFEREFGEMLAQHGEFTSSSGLNGLMVYARLVSNEPIER